MKKISKILIYSSILIISIYLFISIARDGIAHVYLSEYKESLKGEEGGIERQGFLLRKSLRLCSSNAETFFELGKLYVDEYHEYPIDKDSEAWIESYAQVKEIFQEALMLKPTDGRKRSEYAWYIGCEGDTNEAIKQFNTSINFNPADAILHMLFAMWCVTVVQDKIDITNTVQLIENYRNEKKKEETLKSYDNSFINGVSIAKFLSIYQIESDKALLLGARRDRYEYERLADFNLIRFDLDKAILNYKRAKNRDMLTRCYIIKGEYNKAVNILARNLQGDGKLSSSRFSETKKLLMDVTNNDPKNYQPFYWLGKLHTSLGETEQAVSNYKSSIHLNPGHIDSHLDLAELYNQTGKVDLAIKEYEAILEKAPNHKEATRLLREAFMFEYKDDELLKTP